MHRNEPVSIDGREVHPGEAIRIARIAKGWTQYQLAIEVDVDNSIISRWECGRDWPFLWNYLRVLRVCGYRVVVERIR